MNFRQILTKLSGQLPFDWEEELILHGDAHSPVMRVSEYLIKPAGLEARVWWAHEGRLYSEWVPAQMLEARK